MVILIAVSFMTKRTEWRGPQYIWVVNSEFNSEIYSEIVYGN